MDLNIQLRFDLLASAPIIQKKFRRLGSERLSPNTRSKADVFPHQTNIRILGPRIDRQPSTPFYDRQGSGLQKLLDDRSTAAASVPIQIQMVDHTFGILTAFSFDAVLQRQPDGTAV
jgi:hypothetical protein